MAVKPIPDEYRGVTPYLVVKDPVAAIEFYKEAFGATETLRLTMPGGGIAHAEVSIGGSPVMLSGEWPDFGAVATEPRGGKSVGFGLYVEDCDAGVARAVAAGATAERPPADQFYGDRSGTVVDPFGHKWTISTRKEDLTPEQMQRRMEEWMAGGGMG